MMGERLNRSECMSTAVNTDANLDEDNQVLSSSSQELDPEMLSAIGYLNLSDNPKFGEDIHKTLSQTFLPLLKEGLAKEEKDKILKEYPVPGNCRLLQAPKLNKEISDAVTASIRQQDEAIADTQQQLGQGITAINKSLNILIMINNEEVKKAVKHLSNGCRILCDLHALSTQKRRDHLIASINTPEFDKTLLNAIQDTERDDTLFGNKLSENIESNKNQGQIKKPGPVQSKMSNANNKSNTGARKKSVEPKNEHNLPSTSTGQNEDTTQNANIATYPGYEEFIKKSCNERRLSREKENELLSDFKGKSNSTKVSYDNYCKQWWDYCNANKINKYVPVESSIIDFFKETGKKYQNLGTHRAALLPILGDSVKSANVAKTIKDINDQNQQEAERKKQEAERIKQAAEKKNKSRKNKQ